MDTSLTKAIGAVLFYCLEAADLETRHQMCLQTAESWCKYQADKLNNTSTYKEKPDIPAIIRETIRPVFISLSDEELLSKCLHGKTQNNNESLNGLIWKRCPKDVFVGRTTLELGVASAIISFNNGLGGVVKVFSELNISPGKYTDEHCLEKDHDRINLMESKSTHSIKQRCKSLRA